MKKTFSKNEETPAAATVEASNQINPTKEITDMSNSTTVETSSNVLPVIAGHEIAIDEHGRFNLNAIHKASGGEAKNRPSMWMQNKQAKELINEVASQSRNSSFAPVEAYRGGSHPGTFAIDLLAVSYAGWISPKFQLQVNQVFLDYRMGKLKAAEADQQQALPSPLTPAHQLGIQKEIGVRVYECVKDESNRPKAFKAIHRYLKNRFEVGSYKDIPDRDYTQALAAVHAAPLEGEWIEAQPKPELDIHFPISK
ncbi:hypothetical protein LMG33818_000882 [Halomonadaceae bacterium LMG 33818]|uniref:KilA-N domain-containing protein n=1 Tax=Cernens ardua TaxID=3402176 RepID=UPI003EDC7263